MNKLLTQAMRGVILAYRYMFSPIVGRNCRFQPTCSLYALEAIEKYGPWKGGWLMVKRVLSCHPIKVLGGKHGYDPVP